MLLSELLEHFSSAKECHSSVFLTVGIWKDDKSKNWEVMKLVQQAMTILFYRQSEIGAAVVVVVLLT